MASPSVITPPSVTPVRGQLAAGPLTRALRDEYAVLEDLVTTLDRQRAAVATDDIETVNDTVFAAHRLLGAYREARSRRRGAVSFAVGGGDGSVDDLATTFGESLSQPERDAADALRSIARRLVDAVDQNRRLLQAAMSNGDAFFKILTGTSPQAPQGYAPPRRHASATATLSNGPRVMDLRG